MKLTDAHNAIRFAARHQISQGKMSIKLLAHLAKLGQPQTSNFVRGRRNLSIRSLSAILEALDYDCDILPKRTGEAAVRSGSVRSALSTSRPSRPASFAAPPSDATEEP